LSPPHFVGDPATRLKRAYGGTKVDVTTYHNDLNRTGWNPTETDLTTASVQSAKFGLLATLSVDGNVFAQPLLVSGFGFPDGSTHDLLIIATGHNSVYAFDAQTYQVLWQRNLGTPQSPGDLGCGDVQPEVGITATPVIVRTADNSATIYVVAAVESPAYHFVTKLHALNLATGADLVADTKVAPSARLSDGSTVTFDQKDQWIRAGLAYANGSIYMGVASHCDHNDSAITGWVLRYAPNLKLQHAFNTVRTPGGTELASIWMTGFAPAIDPSGNVFVVTGNGDFTAGQKDYGESVLKLTPTLESVTTYFTPSNYGTFNLNDTDFGSGGVMLLPPVSGQTAPALAVALGKSGVLYLLDKDKLGGEHGGDSGALQSQNAGGGGLWGGPAYYDGPAGPTVYTQTNNDLLRAWSVATGSKPSLTNNVSGASYAGYGGSLPIVSSNGATAGTGIVWLIDRAPAPFAIEAYDAVALGNPIFAASVGMWSNSQGNAFLTPMEANGRVYAPGYLVVQVYGLTP
jgi:hypothetical protein